MNHHNTTIKYIQEGNCFNDEVNIEVSTIEGQSDIILLIVPGIDGSVDGYKNKYKTIAENINSRFGATVIRMSNPSNMAGLHLRNLFEVLEFIENTYDLSTKTLYIMGHSLGAYMTSIVSPIFDYIDKILLINPATLIDNDVFNDLSQRPRQSNIFLISEQDPSFKFVDKIKEVGTVYIQPNADHHFSANHLKPFYLLPKNISLKRFKLKPRYKFRILVGQF